MKDENEELEKEKIQEEKQESQEEAQEAKQEGANLESETQGGSAPPDEDPGEDDPPD